MSFFDVSYWTGGATNATRPNSESSLTESPKGDNSDSQPNPREAPVTVPSPAKSKTIRFQDESESSTEGLQQPSTSREALSDSTSDSPASKKSSTMGGIIEPRPALVRSLREALASALPSNSANPAGIVNGDSSSSDADSEGSGSDPPHRETRRRACCSLECCKDFVNNVWNGIKAMFHSVGSILAHEVLQDEGEDQEQPLLGDEAHGDHEEI